MKTATETVKKSLALWIQNQETMKSYPDDEDKCQSMACNAMRIEAGIKFLQNPLAR